MCPTQGTGASLSEVKDEMGWGETLRVRKSADSTPRELQAPLRASARAGENRLQLELTEPRTHHPWRKAGRNGKRESQSCLSSEWESVAGGQRAGHQGRRVQYPQGHLCHHPLFQGKMIQGNSSGSRVQRFCLDGDFFCHPPAYETGAVLCSWLTVLGKSGWQSHFTGLFWGWN